MRCPSCNSKIEDDSKFCPICGKELIIKCPKCGQLSNYPAVYCKNCGTKVREPDVEKSESKNSVGGKEKVISNLQPNFIFSIISMSLMLFAMLLMFGFSFAPFMLDEFFPLANATIVGYLADTFSNGISNMFQNKEYLIVISSFLVSIIFVVFLVFSIIYISISIPAFIRSIKAKTFLDLSKKLYVMFSLYMCLFVFFVGFALRQFGFGFEKISAYPIAIVIVVPLILSFNIFAQTYQKKNCSLFDIIFNSLCRICIYVLMVVIIFSLGGLTFNTYCLIESSSRTITCDCGNIGLVSIILSAIPSIYNNGAVYVIFSVILSLLAAVFEMIALLFILMMFAPVFSLSLNNYNARKRFIVFTSLMVVFFIINIVLNANTSRLINRLNDIPTYGAIFRTQVENAPTITALVISAILLGIQITYFAVSKRRKPINDEKN